VLKRIGAEEQINITAEDFQRYLDDGTYRESKSSMTEHNG